MLGNIILAVILIVLSLVWSGVGIFELGLWIPGVSADSGFIPTVFGIVTLICSVIMLVQNLKKYNESKNAPQAAEEVKKEEPPASQDIKGKIPAFVKKYAPVFFGLFGLLSLQYLGLIPMVFLIILGWMKLMNQFPWKKSILFAAVVTVVIYLIFDIWLQIPFPGLI
mgnify:CR=1 FL=1